MFWSTTLSTLPPYFSLGASCAHGIGIEATRPVESHIGDRGNILVGPPNIFTGPLWEENFWIFLFKMVHSGVLNISGVSYPPPHPLDGPGSHWTQAAEKNNLTPNRCRRRRCSFWCCVWRSSCIRHSTEFRSACRSCDLRTRRTPPPAQPYDLSNNPASFTRNISVAKGAYRAT